MALELLITTTARASNPAVPWLIFGCSHSHRAGTPRGYVMRGISVKFLSSPANRRAQFLALQNVRGVLDVKLVNVSILIFSTEKIPS
jgi:hypothetical protein